MLTIAIPTMNRWNAFLKNQLPVYLDHSGVECVVVCDENGQDIEAMCHAGLDMNPKLRLYQNETVLGVYGNKRQCISKAPTAYVAVLDSDNYFTADYIDKVLELITNDIKSHAKTIFCAGQNERLFLDTGLTENRIQHFSGMRITRDNWNSVLEMPSWNFLLNDGNAVWPTSVIRHLPDLPEERVVGTDSILAMQLAVRAGYTMSVEADLKYVHTVHEGSHWTQNAVVSSRLLAMNNWRI